MEVGFSLLTLDSKLFEVERGSFTARLFHIVTIAIFTENML